MPGSTARTCQYAPVRQYRTTHAHRSPGITVGGGSDVLPGRQLSAACSLHRRAACCPLLVHNALLFGFDRLCARRCVWRGAEQERGAGGQLYEDYRFVTREELDQLALTSLVHLRPNPKAQTPNPDLQTSNPKPNLNPKPQTTNRKSQTTNPDPQAHDQKDCGVWSERLGTDLV
jgi:hypothetical protein